MLNTSRPRRNRFSSAIRGMVQETRLHTDQFVYPLFIIEGTNLNIPIASMPGISRFTIDLILIEIEECVNLGINNFILFPAINDSLKDKYATESKNKDGLYLQCIFQIKKNFPEVTVITDVAMDPYSSDGHDGFVENDQIVNDLTLPILAEMAISQAQAGADIMGPSDMMDGRVGYIRKALDANGFYNVGIMSYTAKYASAFYGPFRDALDSAPKKGDKKTYQMNPANRKEALREAFLDQEEGADFLMVKPALSYLDIISDLKQNTNLPIVAYNVSGEYAMVKATAEKGWLSEIPIMIEILTSIKRAGADIIISYHAKKFAEIQKS